MKDEIKDQIIVKLTAEIMQIGIMVSNSIRGFDDDKSHMAAYDLGQVFTGSQALLRELGREHGDYKPYVEKAAKIIEDGLSHLKNDIINPLAN